MKPRTPVDGNRYLTPRHIPKPKVRKRRCANCKSDILAAEEAGTPVELDPYSLNQLGALAAAMAGLQTWLEFDGRISRRTVAHIQWDADPNWADIRRDHKCTVGPPPNEWIKPPPDLSIRLANNDPGF